MKHKGETITLSTGDSYRVFVGNRARTAAGFGIPALEDDEIGVPVSDLPPSKQLQMADMLFRCTLASTTPRLTDTQLDEMEDADYSLLVTAVAAQLGGAKEEAAPLSEAPAAISS